jgi:hypothetical protein
MIELVAQLVEHYTFNVGVLGSSPSGFTKKEAIRNDGLFFYAAYNRFYFTTCSSSNTLSASLNRFLASIA